MTVSCTDALRQGYWAAERFAESFEGRDDEVPPSMLGCCYGAALSGLDRCTCWEPVYDIEQAAPHEGRFEVRADQCVDCAYLPGSPEQQSPDDAELLEELALRGDRFWCHQGMRRVVLWRHPSGAMIPGHPGDYAPHCASGVAYRVDGQPADLCRGWDRARRAHRAKEVS